MAEVAGVVLGAVGVAGLFSACVDVFELVKICHTREHSLEILTTKLGNQKARFVIWGRTMGLDKAQEGGGHDARLDEPVRRDSVMRTMKLIIKLFDESDVLTERYGLRKWEDVLGFGSALDYRPENAVWRDMFRRAQRKLGRLKRKNDAMPAKVPATLRWAIVDQDRFLKLVNDLRDLVDDLESMTRFPDIAERRRRIVAYEVESISDVASLEAVMEAGETDPTELSDSASLLVESMSVNSQGLGSRSTPGRSLSSEAGTFCSARSYLSPLRSIEKEPHLSAKEPSRLASHRSEEEPFNRVQHRIEKKLPTLASSELTPKGLWALGKLTRMRKEEVPYRLHPVLPDADPVFKAWVNASRAAFQRILEDNRAFVRLLPDLPQPKASPHTNNQAKQAHEHIIWELKKQMGSFVNERFTFCPIEVSNFHHLFGLVLGASGTPYAGGLFFLDITYPTEYPFKPNRVHHPRISDRGNILDLPRWNGEGEGPVDVFGKVIPPMKDKRNLRFDVPELLFTIQSETLGPLPEMNLCLFTQSNRDSRILDLSLIESYEIFSATTQFRTLQFADHRLPYNIKRFNLQRIDEALKTGSQRIYNILEIPLPQFIYSLVQPLLSGVGADTCPSCSNRHFGYECSQMHRAKRARLRLS